MSRLIDADDLLTAFPIDDEPMLTKSCVRMTIRRMPTINPQRWIPVSERLPGGGVLGGSMTGQEAWSIVAQLLAPYLNAESYKGVPTPLMDAWVTVFGALKEYDERRADERRR